MTKGSVIAMLAMAVVVVLYIVLIVNLLAWNCMPVAIAYQSNDDETTHLTLSSPYFSKSP